MIIRQVNPLEDKRWDNYISEHPLSSIYHHSHWKLLIESTFKNLRPYYIALFDNQGEIKGVLPSFISNKVYSSTHIISLPLACHCDPLFYSDDAMYQTLNTLIKKLEMEGIKFIEIRSSRNHQVIEDLRFRGLKYYCTHILKIDKDLMDIKKSFNKSSVQRRITQSLNFDLSLTLGRNTSDVKIFYHLESLNRRKIGLPPLPFNFFKNMWEIFYPKGLISLLLVKHKGQHISGIILLKYKNYVYYEYAAADPSFLNLHPNHFAIWKAIQLARQEGYTYFDFGRTSIDNKGLMSFKKRWGTEERTLYYYYFPSLHSISAESRESLKFKFTKSICKKMPIKGLQIFGNIAYNYLA